MHLLIQHRLWTFIGKNFYDSVIFSKCMFSKKATNFWQRIPVYLWRYLYRVFRLDFTYFEDLGDHLKTAFMSKWRYLCIPEVWAFEFHQSVFKKLTKTGLNSLCIDLGGLCNLWPQQSYLLKKVLILMIWSSLAPKWPILDIFCGMDHQKPNFSLIYGTLSERGCWG